MAVTARKPETVREFEERFPQTALVAQLDVTDEASVAAAVARTMERFGSIDALVNNAGYCLRGAVEECTFEEIRKQFETNFFGAVRMIQHVLPFMRKERKGVIVNFSSIAALSTSAGSAFYGASKCAVEGLSDGLRKEVEPLGVRVMVVEPGPFKTDFFYRSMAVNERNIEDYRDTAGKRKVRLKDPEDSGMKGWGDTEKAAQVIIRAVEGKRTPFRLLLGSTAVRIAEEHLAARAEETRTWKSLSVQTDA